MNNNIPYPQRHGASSAGFGGDMSNDAPHPKSVQ
jgi:hypothetical protein